MERENATIESDQTNADDRLTAPDSVSRDGASAAAETPAATIAATRTATVDDEALPNALTIIGHGSPSSFEVTVDGTIELLEDDGGANTTIVSGSTVEGTIETGTVRFGFTGDLTDVTFVDRRITGLSPAAVPNVHVDYPAPERSQS